jgi:biotin-dependent carboxylase-like uncharacterized protein
VIEVLRAPPFAIVQDLGRPGHRAEGVPPAGAMDPDALRLLNRVVGNDQGAAGLEWALGAGELRCDRHCWAAVGPGSWRVNGTAAPPWTAVEVGAGDVLSLEPPMKTRFSYLALSGGLDVPLVLGSRSTYLTGRFGGWEGRLLKRGDSLPIGAALSRPPGPVPPELLPEYERPVRVLPGPQGRFFGNEAWTALLSADYGIAPASDRMGYRLEGPALTHSGPPALPSEAACPGAIQVPDGAPPIVLMNDGPTVGGYPKIAVVITADLGLIAQMMPGARPRFVMVTQEQAVAALRERSAAFA